MALSLAIGYVIHELSGSAEEAIVSLATSVELLITSTTSSNGCNNSGNGAHASASSTNS